MQVKHSLFIQIIGMVTLITMRLSVDGLMISTSGIKNTFVRGTRSSSPYRPSTCFSPLVKKQYLKRQLCIQHAIGPYSESLSPGIASINAVNGELDELLSTLRGKPHFCLYSADVMGTCEYIPQELFECYSETCEIYPVDEDEVPRDIQAIDKEEHEFELDGWARWDMPTDDYYDITQFPESFTGYDGSEVWRFIHDKISFHDDDIAQDDEYDADNWKADFNKAVSGLHSMISAQVIRGIEEKITLNEDFDDDCVWVDPKVEFDRRLGPNGNTPQAIENMYFTYMLLLSAVSVAKDRLLSDCESGKIDEGAAEELLPVLRCGVFSDNTINVASRRLCDHAVKDADSISALWEARMRTRELFRIMNCAQCNKCLLHGKISVLGLSTAFNILLGRKGNGGDMKKIHRVELASLMTTLSKFSSAVQLTQKMSS